MTVEKFLAYSSVTKDLIENGIITYTTEWGVFKGYTVDWDMYHEYFDRLDFCAADIGAVFDV